MANPALFPIQVSTTFRFGPTVFQLDKAESFTVNHKDHTIDIYNKDASKFQLIFENVQKMYDCIDVFLNQTQMRPSLFHVQNVHAPIHQYQDGEWIGVVDLDFETESERDLCSTLYGKFYSFPIYSINRGYRVAGEVYDVQICLKETTSKEEQIVRIGALFQNVMTRFGESGIMDALYRTNSIFQKMDLNPPNNQLASEEESEDEEIKDNDASSDIIQPQPPNEVEKKDEAKQKS